MPPLYPHSPCDLRLRFRGSKHPSFAYTQPYSARISAQNSGSLILTWCLASPSNSACPNLLCPYSATIVKGRLYTHDMSVHPPAPLPSNSGPLPLSSYSRLPTGFLGLPLSPLSAVSSLARVALGNYVTPPLECFSPYAAQGPSTSEPA